MCFDPVSLGLMAAGTGLSLYGSSSAAKEKQDAYNAAQTAQNNVLNSTLDKEAGFQNNNTQAIKDVVSKFSPAAQSTDLTNAQGARDATIGSTITAPGAVPSGDYTPGIIKNTNAQKLLDGFQYATGVAKAKAKVGSYGDVMGANARNISDTSGTVDMNNNFAAGNKAILPDQQQLAAASVYRPPSALPGVETGLGNLMAGLGASGKASGFTMPNIGGAFMGGGSPSGYGR